MPDLEAEYGSLADAIRRLEAPMGPMGRLARSKKGALGPYQFMPATARQYGLDDPTDETQAREAALQYLHDAAVSLNTQDPRLLLAAYNAGPGAVRKYGDVPPYGETQSYVRRGLEYLIPAAEAAETFEVELPDGRVVEGIPVGTTKAEFVAKARANGVEIPESWLQGSEPGGEAAQAAQPMVGAESPVSEALTEMIAPARRVPSAIAEEFARGGEMAGAGMQALTQPTSPLGAVKGLGQAALGGLQQFFSPITGGVRALARLNTHDLRAGLLGVNGVGPETADDIVLYAFERPVFVIDAYTRRIFRRLGHIRGDEGYETLRHLFENTLGPDVSVFNEYHAVIVAHGKDICRVRPRCGDCGLSRFCPASEVRPG